MDASTAMSSPEQMSLSFAIDNLVVFRFPPEVISHRSYLSHMMGCPGKSSLETSLVNSSMVASWVATSISSSRSSSLKRDSFAASLENNPATWDAVRNSSLLNSRFPCWVHGRHHRPRNWCRITFSSWPLTVLKFLSQVVLLLVRKSTSTGSTWPERPTLW